LFEVLAIQSLLFIFQTFPWSLVVFLHDEVLPYNRHRSPKEMTFVFWSFFGVFLLFLFFFFFPPGDSLRSLQLFDGLSSFCSILFLILSRVSPFFSFRVSTKPCKPFDVLQVRVLTRFFSPALLSVVYFRWSWVFITWPPRFLLPTISFLLLFSFPTTCVLIVSMYTFFFFDPDHFLPPQMGAKSLDFFFISNVRLQCMPLPSNF